jgi:hypothetical protein
VTKPGGIIESHARQYKMRSSRFAMHPVNGDVKLAMIGVVRSGRIFRGSAIMSLENADGYLGRIRTRQTHWFTSLW